MAHQFFKLWASSSNSTSISSLRPRRLFHHRWSSWAAGLLAILLLSWFVVRIGSLFSLTILLLSLFFRPNHQRLLGIGILLPLALLLCSILALLGRCISCCSRCSQIWRLLLLWIEAHVDIEKYWGQCQTRQRQGSGLLPNSCSGMRFQSRDVRQGCWERSGHSLINEEYISWNQALEKTASSQQ